MGRVREVGSRGDTPITRIPFFAGGDVQILRGIRSTKGVRSSREKGSELLSRFWRATWAWFSSSRIDMDGDKTEGADADRLLVRCVA